MRKYLPILAIALLPILSCRKNQSSQGDEVSVYLLDNAVRFAGRCEIDPSGSTLAATPIVSNMEIIAFYRNTDEFMIAPAAYERLKDLRDGTGFAVKLGDKVLFYGIVKPWISSSSCDHSITMTSWTPNKMIMSRGYPGTFDQVPDHLNDPRLISALLAQGKLR